ncbi:flagellar FlbD family protein [Nesterenkonia lutea]|uniref:Flagellar protein FlbD n=1 Tax=Nesterenkonia lutea TaxID=272919 RepID=A0ABR9JFB9_9MICC|nr:flagellar FlbD family protein [Nesterenkonia lutea]MBE1524626.1 flagellar protein FlbD [Nesterenkonia lutea]
MIVVTRLNGTRFAVNPDLIERIQEHPDTVLLMINGARYVVLESMDDVIGLIADFRARVVAGASTSASGLPDEPPPRMV